MPNERLNTSRMEDMNKDLVSLLRGESGPLIGDEGSRQDELLQVHHKYTNVIRSDYQGIRSSKSSTDSTYDYIVNALIGHKDYGQQSRDFQSKFFSTGNDAQDRLLKNMRLEKLFTMGETYVIAA